MIIKEQMNEQITNPERAAKIVYSILAAEHETDRDKEHFWVIGLDTNMMVKFIELASLGSLDQTIIKPREIFRLAIMKAVKGMVVLHNHPSDFTMPSQADRNVMEKLVKAGEILDIPVFDHVIIGSGVNEDNYYSFKENGLI